MNEDQIKLRKKEGYSEKMPKEIGLYLMVCNENDFEPEPVAITGSPHKLMSHSEHNCRMSLRYLHEGLTYTMWKKVA